jgi:acyl phosphate:glycerol-3-phosphate acyltransferase
MIPKALIFSYGAFFAAYLIGSLSFAVIISRVMGLADPRTYGSHNPGATNVLRGGNRVAAVLTLALDAVKGYAPVALANWKSFDLGFDDTTVAFVGVAAFIGHLWPVFFRFKGGKGVATALGVLFGFDPWLGLGVLVTWCVVAAVFRYSSLASIVASILAPFYELMFYNTPSIALAVVTMSLLLIWRHWRNIVLLLSGRESRIGAKESERRHRRRRRHRPIDAPGVSASAPQRKSGP